ncbi:hypothetical protein NPIL_261491, partial [Nephila pilipes]
MADLPGSVCQYSVSMLDTIFYRD